MQAQNIPPAMRKNLKTNTESTQFRKRKTKNNPMTPIRITFFSPYLAPKNPLGIEDRTKLNEKNANEKAESLLDKPSSFTPYKVNNASIPWIATNQKKMAASKKIVGEFSSPL